MKLSFTAETIPFETLAVKIAVPPPSELKRRYEQSIEVKEFPYWAKVWPAAKALSRFMIEHPSFVTDKKVTEIAAGLGLPSMVAASMARVVVCTDAIPEAVEFINTSVQLNAFTNVTAMIYNWDQEPSFETDVLLMSDVNYNPAAFPQLFLFIQTQVQKGITILLSTPQRLMAKPFIESIANYISQQEEYEIEEKEETTICSVFVLNAP